MGTLSEQTWQISTVSSPQRRSAIQLLAFFGEQTKPNTNLTAIQPVTRWGTGFERSPAEPTVAATPTEGERNDRHR
jgi:hypothetical protein